MSGCFWMPTLDVAVYLSSSSPSKDSEMSMEGWWTVQTMQTIVHRMIL